MPTSNEKAVEMIQKGRRFCYYPTQNKEYEGKPHVVMVFADEPGYRLVNPDTDLGGTWPSMEHAQRAANHYNHLIGVTEKDVVDIVSSSMRCFDPAEAEQRRASRRGT